MNLLVLSARPPWPPTMADSMTVDRLVRFLSARGHEVDLLTFVQDESEARVLREGLGPVCREIETVPLPRLRSYASTALTLPGRLPMQVQYYRSAGMRRAVERRVAARDYDLVYTHLIRMAEYTRNLDLPKVMGVQISQALNLGRMIDHVSDPFRKLFYRLESSKVRPYEAHACADFDRVFLCGPSDIEALSRTAPVPNALVCPHGQDVPPLETVRGAQREPGAIAISGVMSTYTNVDAATWFATEIFPRIEKEVPEAAFWIVGRNPQRGIAELARPPRVVVTGEVPNVGEWLCRAQVAVAPLRIGAGMQNKVVQAMACELPVIATSIANEGIGGTSEENILLRDDAESFASTIVQLLNDAPMRERVGRAARAFAETHWTWEAHFQNLEAVLKEVVAERS